MWEHVRFKFDKYDFLMGPCVNVLFHIYPEVISLVYAEERIG